MNQLEDVRLQPPLHSRDAIDSATCVGEKGKHSWCSSETLAFYLGARFVRSWNIPSTTFPKNWIPPHLKRKGVDPDTNTVIKVHLLVVSEKLIIQAAFQGEVILQAPFMLTQEFDSLPVENRVASLMGSRPILLYTKVDCTISIKVPQRVEIRWLVAEHRIVEFYENYEGRPQAREYIEPDSSEPDHGFGQEVRLMTCDALDKTISVSRKRMTVVIDVPQKQFDGLRNRLAIFVKREKCNSIVNDKSIPICSWQDESGDYICTLREEGRKDLFLEYFSRLRRTKYRTLCTWNHTISDFNSRVACFLERNIRPLALASLGGYPIESTDIGNPVSRLDREKCLTHDRWAVTLVSTGGQDVDSRDVSNYYGHAAIVIETFYTDVPRVFLMDLIKGENAFGLVRIFGEKKEKHGIEGLDADKSSYPNYELNFRNSDGIMSKINRKGTTSIVDKNDVMNLLRSCKGDSVQFGILGLGKTYNCIEWALEKMKSIGVDVQEELNSWRFMNTPQNCTNPLVENIQETYSLFFGENKMLDNHKNDSILLGGDK